MKTSVALSLASSSHLVPYSPESRHQQSLTGGHHPLLSLNINLNALARTQALQRVQELYQCIAALH